jgi:hypothetical protein
MTRNQTTILWLGLILIGLNLIIRLGDFKAVIFGSPAPANPAPTTGNPPLAPGQSPTPPANQVV